MNTFLPLIFGFIFRLYYNVACSSIYFDFMIGQQTDLKFCYYDFPTVIVKIPDRTR